MKTPVFLRNFVIFTIILLACISGLVYFTIRSSQEIEYSDKWVGHSQSVIKETQNLVDVILGDAPNGCGAEVGWRAVELLDAAYRSAAQDGSFVEVQSLYQ